jgi:hypothetical protein
MYVSKLDTSSCRSSALPPDQEVVLAVTAVTPVMQSRTSASKRRRVFSFKFSNSSMMVVDSGILSTSVLNIFVTSLLA